MSSSGLEIVNARIEEARIEFGHGCLTIWIDLDYGGSFQGFGGFALDAPPRDGGSDRMAHASCGHFIARMMSVVGVGEWSKLAGESVRVKRTGRYGGRIEAIGHFIKDRWFEPRLELAELDESA